jgi:hypothetical protein
MTDSNLDHVRAALAASDFAMAEATFERRPVLVGATSEFRWSWVATRLHTFVFVVDFAEETVDEAMLDRYLNVACGYALHHKGGLPRGLQTGVAAVTVALAANESESLTHWSSRVHGRRFAAITFPASVVTSTGRVTRPSRLLGGAVYARHLMGVVDHVVAPALTGA